MTRLLAAFFTIALAAGACSSGDPSSPTTARPTTTTFTTTIPTAASSATVLDVVALGGSNVAGYGLGAAFDPGGTLDPDNAYPAIYSRSLAEEAGVETRYRAHHTLETVPWQNRSLSTWNQLLATDDKVRADLESADVVIIEIGVHTVILKCGTHLTFTKECLIDVTATMPAEYERLFRTVDELVDDGTIVIALNQGLARPTSEYWRDHPDWPAMKSEAFEVWWGGLDTAAAAHNVIVIDTAHMSGDPNEFGLGPEYTQLDGAHLNPEGHHLFADLLLEADGIEPVA